MTDDATDPSAFSLADLNTTINHEPRILDLTLAKGLGFKKPRDIRPLIERHLPALERLGRVCRMVRQTSSRGGRPTAEYWLTKKQAVYIATKANTDRATDIAIAVVEVFDAATASGAPGLSAIEADVVGHMRRMTPAQRTHLHVLAAAADLKSSGSPSAPGAAALPPPVAEPFFCTGCAARRQWTENQAIRDAAAARPPHQATYAEIRYFPLTSGPITRTELDILAAHRLAVKSAMVEHGTGVVQAVSNVLGTLIGQQVVEEFRRNPPEGGK